MTRNLRQALLATAAIGMIAGVGFAEAPQAQAGGTAAVATGKAAPDKAQRQLPAQAPRSAAEQAARMDWLRRRSTRPRGGLSGPGWTNRHVQRMARKRRNQARHRATCSRTRS